MGNNCWMNALLQMIVSTPSLLKAYRTVGEYYKTHGSAAEQQHGKALLEAYELYQTCLSLSRNTAIPDEQSQNIRAFFHHFWPNEIRASHKDQEDANNALMLLLSRYEDVLKIQSGQPKEIHGGQPNPLYHAICPEFCTPIQTTRIYDPIGEPYEAPTNIECDSYNPATGPCCSHVISNDCRVGLHLHGNTQLSFSELLLQYFRNAQRDDDANCVRRRLPDGKIQKFVKKELHVEFARPPSEFILSLERFATNHATGQRYKITDCVQVPRTLIMPAEASATKTPLAFELTSFVVHNGSMNGGHYISYRKQNGSWYLCDDSFVRPVSEAEVDQALQGSYFHHYQRIETLSQEEMANLQKKQSAPPAPKPLDRATSLLERFCRMDTTRVTPYSPSSCYPTPAPLDRDWEDKVSDLAKRDTMLCAAKAFVSLAKTPNSDLAKLVQAYMKLPPAIIARAERLELQSPTPHKPVECKNNPRLALQSIESIIVSDERKKKNEQKDYANFLHKKMNSPDQSIQAKARKEHEELLQKQIMDLLQGEATDNTSLRQQIAELAESIQWGIHGRIYEAREKPVTDPEYGRNTLATSQNVHALLQTISIRKGG
jgi:hypothetical protein